MRHERVLGILILSDFALAIASVVSEFSLRSLLPSALRAYLGAESDAAAAISDWLLTGLWGAVVAGTVLAWIGLLNLVRAARPLYLGCWIGYLIYLLLNGPVVSTAISQVLQTLMALVGGAIIGLVYFSDLSTRFKPLSEAGGPARDRAP